MGLLLCFINVAPNKRRPTKGLGDEVTKQSLQNQTLLYMLRASGRVCEGVTEEGQEASGIQRK